MRTEQRAGTWSVTQHAVERYIERFKSELALDAARAELESALPTATLMRERTNGGQQRWLIRSLGIIAIVKPAAPNRVVVTIEPEPRDDGLSEIEAELVADYAARTSGITAPLPIDGVPVEKPKKTPAPKQPPPAPKKKQQPPKPDPEARAIRRRLHLASIEAATARQREKTERHRLNMEGQQRKLRAVLRIAVRSVMKNNDEDAIAKIRSIDDGFLSEGFLAAEVTP